MKLRYLIVDPHSQLRIVRRSWIEGLWEGKRRVPALPGRRALELRLVSVLSNEALIPVKIYLLRLPTTLGRFTRANCRTLRNFALPGCVTPQEMFRYHSEGWPADFFSQLAVALDVPCSHLDIPLGIGGPLLMAAALQVQPCEAVQFLR